MAGAELGGVLHGLGTVSLDESTTITIDMELTAEQHDEIRASLSLLGALSPSFHYKLVERNFHDLQSLHRFMVTTLTLGREFGRPDRMGLWNSVMTAIVNWLAAMRLFLDHEQTRLSRAYGKGSPQLNTFLAATANAFDAKAGYRFATKFRNFFLHCSLPHSTISVRSNPSKSSGASANFLISRRELLENFDGWGPAKKDLLGFEEKFDPMPLFEDAMDGVREVQRVVVNLRLDEALAGLQPLTDAIDAVGDRPPGEQPTLFEYSWNGSRVENVTPTPLPVELVRQLRGVASGTDSLRQLVTEELPMATRPPVSLDPARLRREFHRDSRGVQTILVWLNEGGATARFRHEVDRFIDEDGGDGPLIGGLIFVSATLAHIAAGTIGTTPEALMAGLVNVYVAADPTI